MRQHSVLLLVANGRQLKYKCPFQRSFTDSDCVSDREQILFWELGLRKKHTQVSQRQSSLSLIFCPAPLPGSVPENCSGSSAPASDPASMEDAVNRRAGPRQQCEVVLVFGFCCHFIRVFSLKLFPPLPSLCRLSYSPFLFLSKHQSTVLRVIPWPVGIEPCSNRVGQLHGVLFLPPTMVFSIWVKWVLQGALKGKNKREKTVGVRRHGPQSWPLFYFLAVNLSVSHFICDLFLNLAIIY